MKAAELKGQTFNRLLVIKRVENNKWGQAQWLCKCNCKKQVTIIVSTSKLKSGHTQSCGCLWEEAVEESRITHNLSKEPIYYVWNTMKARCYNPKNKSYKDYGGRGIKVCEEWKNNFKDFYSWAISKNYSKGLTIDRINVNGDYCPENCKLSTQKEQGNNKRNNHYLEFNNQSHTISEWADITGLKRDTLKRRIYLGWSVERALTTPVF